MSRKDKRINLIINMLKTQKRSSIKDLSRTFNVSEMTIRRDLEVLQNNNILNLIKGKVIFNESNLDLTNNEYDYSVIQQRNINDKEKEMIAKYAVQLIKPGDSIIIDIGTTTSKILKHINYAYPISVLCFTANSLQEALRKNFDKLIFGGGLYHIGNQLFEGNETIDLIKNYRASIAFISAAGVCDDLGVTCINQEEVLIKKASINVALKKYLVVDSSKFGKVRNCYFADLDEFDGIITDKSLPQNIIDAAKNLNIEIHIADY